MPIAQELEPLICHLAREAQAAEMMTSELLVQIRAYSSAELSVDQMQKLTAKAQEMLTDFTARVTARAADQRSAFYAGPA